MAMEENYYLIAFKSTHHGIALEKILQEAGKSSRMIPTPREISNSCGLSLRFNREDLAFVLEKIHTNNISIYGIYSVNITYGKKKIQSIAKGETDNV
ncbi:MAG TPA: DUF3343 domain-containing protein [Eubacteriaceae bacterium]|jgi:hypothetical protein|nr:DUF3343 domain-containing protein [Eubacteriaceae bacterium]